MSCTGSDIVVSLSILFHFLTMKKNSWMHIKTSSTKMPQLLIPLSITVLKHLYLPHSANCSIITTYCNHGRMDPTDTVNSSKVI